jgi:DNA relaxase NicK
MQSSTSVLESQLDWLTTAVHSVTKAAGWRSYADRWARREVADGNKRGPFHLGNYEGWICGRVRFAERDAAALFQLSGDLARQHFDLLWIGHDTLTRIDLAVTVRTDAYDPIIGAQAYSDATAYRREHPKAAMASLVQDSDGGSTCYLGRRSSDLYCRIYNKHAECLARHDPEGAVHYANCWRYELELKGPAAHAFADALSTKPNKANYIQSTLYEYLAKHGIVPLFERTSVNALVPGFRRRSDRDSRLEWLATSVKPAVTWLLGNTDRAEVLTRLGLD